MIDNMQQDESVTFSTGDRVFVKWNDGYLYPGIIKNVNEDEVEMFWDSDNSTEIMPFDSLKSLVLEQGDTIECRWNQEDSYYDAEIISINGEDLELKYIDGGEVEKTKINMTRLQDNYNGLLKSGETIGSKSYEGPNAEAYNLINEMFYTLSYVDKEGNRFASSLEEADKAEEILNRAEEKIQDPSDTEIGEIIDQNREHIAEARTRKFFGAWWLIIAAGIVALFSFYSAFDTIGSKITPETATRMIDSEIRYTENSISRIEAKSQKTEQDLENLELFKERLVEKKKITPEEYASDYGTTHFFRGLKQLFWAFVSLGWIIAYYFASKPYGYMRFKRKKEYEVLQKATSFGAKFASGIMKIFWSMPITTYVTKYTDGSEERSSDALFILGLQIFVTIAVIGTILYIAYIVIPIITVISFVRNYPEVYGAKQLHALFKKK